MVGYIEVWLAFLWAAGNETFQRAKRTVIALMLEFGAVIFVGALLGNISFQTKLIWFLAALSALIWLTIRYAGKRFPEGAGAGVVYQLAAHERPRDGFIRWGGLAIPEGIYNYVQLVAATLASELAVGLIALWFPFHVNILMALLAVPAAILLISYTIYWKGEFWWRRVVYAVGVFTMATPFVVIGVTALLPSSAEYAVSSVGNFDKRVYSVLDGSAHLETVVWVVGVLLLVALILPKIGRMLDSGRGN